MAIIKLSKERAAQAASKVDWAKVDALTDKDIKRAVANDPDAAPILTRAGMLAHLMKRTRERLGLSQADFAARFHMPVGTVRDWEQNRRQPDTASLLLMSAISRDPETMERLISPEFTPLDHA